MASETSDFTTKQRQLIEWLATPKQKREPTTEAEFAKQLGVTDRTFRTWKQKPGLWQAVADATIKAAGRRLPEVMDSIASEAENGNVSAARLYVDVLGLLTQKHEVTGKGGGPIQQRSSEVTIYLPDNERDSRED